jgi:hypothetical protein
LKQDRIDDAAFARPSDHGQRLELHKSLQSQLTGEWRTPGHLTRGAHATKHRQENNLFGSFTPYGCVSFLAARIPAATVSRSHMYAPCLVVP